MTWSIVQVHYELTYEVICLSSWLLFDQKYVNVCKYYAAVKNTTYPEYRSYISILLTMCARRHGMTKNFNLQFCLQGSTTVMMFERVFAFVHDIWKSIFETDQIFLKRNYEIQIAFSIFPP